MTNERPTGPGQPQWHSYRCPVCGHADEAEGVGPMASTLACTHCGTDLEVVAPAAEDAAAIVKVASRWRRSP